MWTHCVRKHHLHHSINVSQRRKAQLPLLIGPHLFVSGAVSFSLCVHGRRSIASSLSLAHCLVRNENLREGVVACTRVAILVATICYEFQHCTAPDDRMEVAITYTTKSRRRDHEFAFVEKHDGFE